VTDGVTPPRRERVSETKGQRLFYGLFLPLGVLANLALGVVMLMGLNPASWSDWLQIATGALCCVIAGWLAAAAWSKFYWNRNMRRQVATWRRIADAFFAWVEEAPLPAESLHSLKSSLEEAVPSSEAR
jgi:TRAP-type C4-dicarboxylate transport system permease small subunit